MISEGHKIWMNANGSQAAWVLRQLADGVRITQAYALRKYGVARLAARVKELRNMGIDIRTEMVEVYNRRNKTCKVAMYWLQGA